MKKSLSILLIFLIALNSFGFYLVFGYLYFDCKVESEIAIDNIDKDNSSNIVLFILNKNSAFGWLNNNELIIKYHHYDIVKREIKSDKIYVYCLKDEKEDKVSNEFCAFNNIYENSPSHSKNISDLLLNKLIKNFLSPQLFNLVSRTFNYGNISLANTNYSVPFKNVLSPPPELHII